MKLMTFKEYLIEGSFPGAPKRGSEMRRSAPGEGEPKIRAKRNRKNLPDERNQYHGKTQGNEWKRHRKTQYRTEA